MDSAGNGLTTGEKNLPIEAMKVTVQNLEGVGVEYRAHVSNVGWQDTVNNGEQAGIAGQGNTIEAIQMKLNGENASKYNIYYRTYVEESMVGWIGQRMVNYQELRHMVMLFVVYRLLYFQREQILKVIH